MTVREGRGKTTAKGRQRLTQMSQVNLQPAYREVMATLIQRRQGRAVDFPGDNLLTEYANVTAGREPNRKMALYLLSYERGNPLPTW